jgi:hypothetical protein
MTQAYSTELTLEQSELLASLLPPETKTGRSRTVNITSGTEAYIVIILEELQN